MKVTFLTILLFAMISCENKSSPVEYKEYVESETNGLRVKSVKQKLEFTLQFKPIDYILLNEQIKLLDKSEILMRRNALGNMQYYNFRIKSDGTFRVLDYKCKDDVDYFKRIAYCSGDIQRDFYILQGTDTLQCKLFNFVRNYEMAPYIDFVLAFEGAKKSTLDESRSFIYEDKIFGVGTITLQISKNSLEKLPSLKL